MATTKKPATPKKPASAERKGSTQGATRTPAQGKKNAARSTGGNNAAAAVALRTLQNKCRGYAPGFEGMFGLYLAHNPEETLNTIRIPRVIAWYTGVGAGGTGDQRTTRQTSASATRRHRSRAKAEQTTPQLGGEGQQQPEEKVMKAGRTS